MVQYCRPHFHASFGALADDTWRGILEQLVRADAPITVVGTNDEADSGPVDNADRTSLLHDLYSSKLGSGRETV